MKRLVAVLAVTIVILGVVSGFLFYQNSEMQNQNSLLEAQISEYERNIGHLEAQILEVENQSLEFQNQISELQNKILEQEEQIGNLSDLVRIKGLLKYGWDNPGGLLMISTVNVTIENFGVNTVSGLSVLIEDVSDFQIGNWSDNETIQIEPVKPREIRTISTKIEWSLGSNGNTTATLMLDNKIIDEFTIYR
jgi:cell division protein FtsL